LLLQRDPSANDRRPSFVARLIAEPEDMFVGSVAPEREISEKTVGTQYSKSNQTEQESETGVMIGSRRDSGQTLGMYRPILITSIEKSERN
jgi:hypothetical protein